MQKKHKTEPKPADTNHSWCAYDCVQFWHIMQHGKVWLILSSTQSPLNNAVHQRDGTEGQKMSTTQLTSVSNHILSPRRWSTARSEWPTFVTNLVSKRSRITSVQIRWVRKPASRVGTSLPAVAQWFIICRSSAITAIPAQANISIQDISDWAVS